MNTAKDLADDLIGRAMKMKTFEIVRHLEDPDLIFQAGVVPFDLKMNREGRMTATVHCMTQEEAEEQVDAWIQYLNEGDDL